jgi:cytochrome c-type biogenesis protein CcmH/NrfG
VIARVGVVLLAVVVLALLAVNLRSYDRYEQGQRLALAPDATDASARQAAQLLEDARFFNPDTRPMLAKGSLLVARGGPGAKEGRALLEEAVAKEPDNVVAWSVLASATRRLDPRRSRQARARALELSPVVPGR